MRYPDLRKYITFLFSMLDEFSISEEKVFKRGRPQTYPDALLIVFYAIMALKGITAMRAQQTYLFHHPLMLERCQLPACPSHVTLGRRYKLLQLAVLMNVRCGLPTRNVTHQNRISIKNNDL